MTKTTQDAARRDAEERFRATFDQAAVGIAHLTLDGVIARVNRRYCDMVGYSETELVGSPSPMLNDAEDDPIGVEPRARLLAGEIEHFSQDKRYRRKDGSGIWVRRTESLGHNGDGSPYLIRVIEDITERKATEARLARANRASRVLAECSRALVHATSEPELLVQMCAIAVQSGEYSHAWIGLKVNDERASVILGAQAGFDEATQPASHEITWADDGRYQGIMGRVIQSRGMDVSRDIQNDASSPQRRERARRCGYHASLTLPLTLREECYGGISIYAKEPQAFDQEEIALLATLARDITYGLSSLREQRARRDAEAALRESEERFRAAFEQAAVGMALRDIDPLRPRWLRVNQKLCEMFGYTREELLQLTSVDLTPQEDRSEASLYNELLLRGEITTYTREKRYLRKDGAIVWVNLSVSAVCGADRRPSHIISVIHDITARKDVEARSRESEQRYREVFEQAAVGITRVDLNGIFVDVNEKFAQMLGYDRAELLGRAVQDYTHPDDSMHAIQYRTMLVGGSETSASSERRFIRRDGSVIWVRRTMSPAFDALGNRSYIISVVEDITERKAIEAALLESERFARSTVDALTEHICVIDAAGTIVIANKAWQKLAADNGIDDGAREGANYFEICEQATGMQPRHAKVAQSGIVDVLLGGRAEYVLEYACRGTTAESWFTLRATRFPGDGPQRAVLTHEDITDQVLTARRRAMEFAVSSTLAEAPSLAAAIPQLLRTMCEAMGWAYGARWMPDEQGVGLVRAEFWCDTDLNLDASEEDYWKRTVWSGSGGVIRRALIEREPQWIVDVREDLSFRRRASCASHGFVSAYAFPIIAANQVLGVLEFFAREAQPPDQNLLLITHSIGSQIGQFIQRKEAEEALRVSEETFRATFQYASVGITVCTLDLRYLQVNDHYCDIVGYTRGELLNGMGPLDVNLPGDAVGVQEHRQWLLSGQAPNTVREKQLKRKDGALVWVALVTSVVRDEQQQPQHFITIVQDVSARRAAEEALRESEQKFRQLADNIPEIFWITDARQRRLIYLSPGFEPLTGVRIDDVRQRPRSWLQVVHPDDWERVRLARKVLPNGEYNIEYRIVRSDGTVRWIHDQAFPVRDEKGHVYRIAGIGADITLRKESEEKLLQLARYDGLTGLPNRGLFLERLKHTLAQAERREMIAAVMFLDLDRFKMINDTLGHAAGDELLRHVAQRLSGCVRVGDTVSRFSGDEFVLLLNDLHNAEEGRVVAQKILSEFSEPFRLTGKEVFVSTSIGIALYPIDAEDDQALLANADAAMYRAKESGRNNFQFYTRELNARATMRLELENSLRRALDRCEFRLHYQPKVCVTTREIIGIEALLRWERPGYGLIAPADFIPLLEDTGLIVPVGEWVLGEACRQLRAWNEAGARPRPVSINISGRQFVTRDVGRVVKRVLDENGTDPRFIELEITESVLMMNTEEALGTLDYLKGLGLGLSIDDFGTGYSSLGYLKRFPIDSLKIDRSFIDEVTTDVGDATITRAVIGMAHNLGLRVVGEGVETMTQLDFLVANACDEAQGNLFSPPLPPGEMLKLLRAQRSFLTLSAGDAPVPNG